MLDWHESHQLEFEALPPALTGLRQHLPAAGSPWSKTVNVRTNSSHSVAPSQFQSSLTAFMHPISGAGAMFLHVGRHRSGIGPREVGVLWPGEGFIKVSMGLCQPRHHQALSVRSRQHGCELAIFPMQLNGEQAIC